MKGIVSSYPITPNGTYDCFHYMLLKLASCRHINEWKHSLQMIVEGLGYQLYLLSLTTTDADDDPLSKIVTTYPKSWIDCYREQRFLSVDPILKHCSCYITPFFWDRNREYSCEQTREFWETRESHGIKSGVSIPLQHWHLKGSLSVAFPNDKPNAALAIEHEMLGKLFMVIPYALEGLKGNIEVKRKANFQLTPRQRECLRWVGAGKTSWEISKIINCSERTINFHLTNTMNKLNVSNRQQAIAKAILNNLL